MKPITPFAICLFTAFSIAFVSCQKTNGAAANSAQTAATDSVTLLLTSGSWTVASLTQKTEDNTYKFKDYTLTFAVGGKLTLTKAGVETQGSWSYTPAVTYYGYSSKEAFAINMGTSEPFRRLTGTWNIISRSVNSFKLDNPEVLEDEHLSLIKK